MRNNRRFSQRFSNHRHRPHTRARRLDPSIYQCMVCKKFHPLRVCKKFLKMSITRREEAVNKHRYCVNCLARTHDLRACTSMDMCKRCDNFHHTLLHPKPQRSRKAQNGNARQTSTGPQAKDKKKVTTSPSTEPSTSNNKAIIEAIKSLATILCNESKE